MMYLQNELIIEKDRQINLAMAKIDSLNCASNELNIETDSMIQRVEIADVTGNVLLEVSDVNSNRMILYLDKIQHDGIYFLKVETIKGIEVVKLKRNNN